MEAVKLGLFFTTKFFGEADVMIQSGFDWRPAYGNIKGFTGVLVQMEHFNQSIGQKYRILVQRTTGFLL